MDAKEHAKVWREAARVIAGMDGRQALLLQAAQQQEMLARYPGAQMQNTPQTSQSDSHAWEAYARAAMVLNTIAAEYERAA